MSLRNICQHFYQRHQSQIDKLSLFAILLFIMLFTLETLPRFRPYETTFALLEMVLVGLFSLEYLLRLIGEPQPRRFFFSFYGMVDLLAILPFYLSLGVADLRWIRVLRILRLFRIFKITRYLHAMERLKLTYQEVREELLIFSGITFLLIYLAGVGIYYFEHEQQPEHFQSIPQALWWAVVTLTTVGYGDVYPVTTGGRIFTGILLVLGLSLISIPSGLLASSFTRIVNQKDKNDG